MLKQAMHLDREWMSSHLATQRNPSLAEQRFHPLARKAARQRQRLVQPLAGAVGLGRNDTFDDAFPLNHG